MTIPETSAQTSEQVRAGLGPDVQQALDVLTTREQEYNGARSGPPGTIRRCGARKKPRNAPKRGRTAHGYNRQLGPTGSPDPVNGIRVSRTDPARAQADPGRARDVRLRRNGQGRAKNYHE
ncbi:hypothetical protein N7445_002506 [Penicillium cf. griseofulvum]|nr:hypothetical protein N7445_002506 [Penicillium cf. griseofulvum]